VSDGTTLGNSVGCVLSVVVGNSVGRVLGFIVGNSEGCELGGRERTQVSEQICLLLGNLHDSSIGAGSWSHVVRLPSSQNIASESSAQVSHS